MTMMAAVWEGVDRNHDLTGMSEHARVRWEPWLMGTLIRILPDRAGKCRCSERARWFQRLTPWRSPWDGCLWRMDAKNPHP